MFTFHHDHEKKVHPTVTHRLKGLPAKNDWKIEEPHLEGGTVEVKTGGEGNLLLGLEDFPLFYSIPDSLRLYCFCNAWASIRLSVEVPMSTTT
jgi:hypothetical protein